MLITKEERSLLVNIHKNLIKYILTTGICLVGTMSFANTLTAVDVYQNDGRIMLNATQKPVVKKVNVSENEITLKLSDTEMASNLTSKYVNGSGMENISVMQDGKSTFVTISGDRVSDYKIMNASDNSVIPASSDSNAAIIISSVLFILSLGFMSRKKKSVADKKINTVLADTKTETEKSMLNDLKTLRNRNQVAVTSSIHGNPVMRFANNSANSSMSVPEGLKTTVPFRKVAYLKTAVNS